MHFRAFNTFLAHNSICLVRNMLSPVFSDLPVRPSVTRVDQSKTVEVLIMKFSPYGPYLLFLRGKFHLEILTGSS